MTQEDSNIKDIVSEMNGWEIKILCIILARIGGSSSRTFHRANVKMKATDEELPHVDDSLQTLRTKGFIRFKRAPNNFDVTKKGFKLSKYFREQRQKEIYGDIRLILRS